MARMGDIEREAAEAVARAAHEAAGWFHPFRLASQAPAAQPVTVDTATTRGEPMSLATDLRALADKIEPLGEEALTTLSAVLAHPETAPLLTTLSQLAGVGLPVGLISEVAGGLTGLAKAYQPQQAAA